MKEILSARIGISNLPLTIAKPAFGMPATYMGQVFCCMKAQADEVPGGAGQAAVGTGCCGWSWSPGWESSAPPPKFLREGRSGWEASPPRKQLWNEDEIQCLFFVPETIGNVALV